MADLAVELFEDLPARLVGVPVRSAPQLRQAGFDQWGKQRQQAAQSVGERALGDVQTLVVPVAQQASAGLAVDELRQQRLHPDRHAEFAAREQLRRCRRRHDPRQAAASARRSVAMTPNDAAVGLDLDLQHFSVLRAGKLAQAHAAARAASLRRHVLYLGRQLGQSSPTMAWSTSLLATRAGRPILRTGPAIDGDRLLRL